MSTSVVAMLRSEDSSFAAVVQLLGRFASRVELIHDLEEAVHLIERDNNPIQAVLLPLNVRSGQSGIKACLSAKAHPTLSRVPIIGIAPSKDRAVLEAFYGAGADCVVIMPFDVEQIFLQIEAIARLHRSVSETLAEERDHLAISRGAIEALNASTDAVVVFDTSCRPRFVNDAARQILQTRRGLLPEQFEVLATELRPTLTAVLAGETPPAVTDDGALVQHFVPLVGERGLPLGVAVRLTNAADLAHLRSTLEVSLRAQSLALLGSAALLTHLESTLGGYPLTPIQQFLSSAAREPLRIRVGPLLTALTEILDSILPASLQVTVNAVGDASVALRPSDATRLFGHVLLYAAMRAGPDGKITIECEESASPKDSGRGAVTIVIAAEHGKSRSALIRDIVEEALASIPHTAQAEESRNLVYGLDAAQVLADRYRLRLEFKSSATHTKVRLKVPLAEPVTSTAGS